MDLSDQKLKKILIIEDDLSIRFTLKKFLSRYLPSTEIYTSEDGIQGLGYSFIINPDLVIIDSTLPKYSGRELIDYLITNSKFNTIPVIVLNENENIKENLPQNYFQVSKQDDSFPRSLVELVLKKLGSNEQFQSKGLGYKILNFLSKKIINFSNLSDIQTSKIVKANWLMKIGLFISYFINQVLLSFYLAFFYIFAGRKEVESNIDQKNKDLVSYRSRIYPAVGVALALSFVVLLQVVLIGGAVLSTTLFATKVLAATAYTWDGGGLDGTCGGAGTANNWSCAANWNPDGVPVAADSVTFNATSTKNATVDAGWGGSITNITISAGYSGVITMARSLSAAGTFTTSAGTFTASNQALTVSSTFTMNAGSIFTASSGVTTLSSTFTINGGTFNHNSGTVKFGGGTLSCNNVVFSLVDLTAGNAATINSNCSLPLGNNPNVGRITLNGTLSGTGTITFNVTTVGFNAGAALTGFSGFNSTVTVGISGATFDFSGYTSFTSSTTVTLSTGSLALPANASIGGLTITGGTFTSSSGTLNITGSFNLSISGAPTFNANGGTIAQSGGTMSCNNVTFSKVIISSAGTTVVNSDCSLPLGNNPTAVRGITLNGTLSGTGTLTQGTGTGTFQINAGGALSGFTGLSANGFTVAGGTTDLSAYSSFVASGIVTLSSGSLKLPNGADLNGALTISTGAFTAPSGTMTLAGALTITNFPATTSFNANGGTITFDGSTATLSCNNVTFNAVTFTGQTNTKTISSNCSLPLGNNPTIPNSMTINGTLSGTGTITESTGTILVQNTTNAFSGFSGLILSSLAVGPASGQTANTSLSLSSYTTVTLNNSFTLNTPTNGFTTSFTAPTGTMSVAGAFTTNTGATFTANGGTVNFFNSSATITCNSVTFNLVTFTHGTGIKTVNSGCTLPLGNNPTSPNAITLNGTLSGTGTLTISAGIFLVQNTTTPLSGFSGMVTSSLTVGPASAQSANTTLDLGTFSPVTVNAAFLINTPTNGFTTSFTAPSGTMSVAGAFTLNSSTTFNANTGTLTLNGTGGGSVSCNNTSFSKVILSYTTARRTIGANCNLPLGSNPTVAFGFILNGVVSGSGTLTVSTSTIDLNTGSSLSGFNGLTISAMLVAGSNMDFSSYSTFTATASVTMSSGSLLLPTGSHIGGAFIISSGSFTAPNGAISVSGNFTITNYPATTAFNANGGTIDFTGAAANLACNNVTFHLVTFTGQTGNKTVNSNCNLPLGNNPTIYDDVLLSGTLTGTGTFFVRTNGTCSGSLDFMASTAVISGFTGYDSACGIYNNGGIIDFSSYSPFLISKGESDFLSGSFTLPNNAEIDDAVVISGGTFNAPSGNMSLAGALTISGTPTFNANGGTINFDSVSTDTNATQRILACNGVTFAHVNFRHTIGAKSISANCNMPIGNNPVITGGLVLNGGALTGTGTIDMSDSGTFVNNIGMSIISNSPTALSGFSGIRASYLVFNPGTYDFSTYTTFELGSLLLAGNAPTVFSAPQEIILHSLIQSFTPNPSGITFLANGGTVKFIPLPLNNTFPTGYHMYIFQSPELNLYNLEVDVSNIARTDVQYIFHPTGTQTIHGKLTLKGNTTHPLEIRAYPADGVQYNMSVTNADVSYVDVKDFNNSSGTAIQAFGKNNTDSGNNIGWNFDAPLITKFAVVGATAEGYISTNFPSFTFNETDPNGDQSKYEIQISSNADYSNPVLDYTSSITDGGDKLFKVPNVLYDGNYYVRMKGIDSTGGDSGFINISDGKVVFTIDSQKPTGSVLIQKNDQGNSENDVTLVFDAKDVGVGVSQMIISEDPNFTGAAYEKYSTSKNLTLTGTNKTVYVKFKDYVNNESDVYSATLEIPAPATGNTIPVSYPDGSTGEGLSVVAFKFVDSNGNTLKNLQITIIDLSLSGVTDENGIVVFENVPLGAHQILGVYNNQKFSEEISLGASDKVVTIELQSQVSPLTYIFAGVALVLAAVLIGIGAFYVRNRIRKTHSRKNEY